MNRVKKNAEISPGGKTDKPKCAWSKSFQGLEPDTKFCPTAGGKKV